MILYKQANQAVPSIRKLTVRE